MQLLQLPLVLPEVVGSRVDETSLGVWSQSLYADGSRFVEYVSHQSYFGFPLVHITRGRCPETGRSKPARGILAIGRRAFGVIAIGQFASGIIAIGQLALGVLFGLGQLTCGAFGLGQGAICGFVGIGQVATGYVTIGQIAFGQFVLAQFGLGAHVWDMRGTDPAARQFFVQLWQDLQGLL